MRLFFSPKAALDPEEIGDYIARDNPQRALSFLSELEDHCHQVEKMGNQNRHDFAQTQASGSIAELESRA